MMKTLILVRHAHRDNSQRELDNALDDKGREQAKALRRFFTERFSAKDLEGGLWLVSSPKRRCVETLQPLAKVIGAQVDVHPDLVESGPRETPAAFSGRIDGFLAEWRRAAPRLTVVCGHGDWLPIAVERLSGRPQSFKKGAWWEAEISADTCALKWFIPSFKPFYRG